MIERKANELIHDFFKNDKRSLLVTGARQVGKTFAIRKIGKECFDQVVPLPFSVNLRMPMACCCVCLPSRVSS